MSNRGLGQWFNDTRFNLNGPQRLRNNVTQILNDLNQQLMQENPELLSQVSDQIQRLNDVLHGRTISNRHASVPNSPAGASNVNILASPANNRNANYVNSTLRSRSMDETPLSAYSARLMNSRMAPNTSVVLNMETPDIQAAPSNSAPPRLAENVERVAANAGAAASDATNPDVNAVRRSPEWRNLVEISRNPEVQQVVRYACFFVPFLLLVMLRAVFTHTADIFTLVILFCTFFYADRTVTRQVAAKNSANCLKVIWIIVCLLFQLYILYYVAYEEENLQQALIFHVPKGFNEQHVYLSSTLWSVLVVDLTAKFLTLVFKSMLILLPYFIISLRRKPVWYQWIEVTSHMYRWWLPLIPWWCYMVIPVNMGIFKNIVAVGYVSLKVVFFHGKFRAWYTLTKLISRPVPFGHCPSAADLLNCGPQCSICYCEFTTPVQLVCKHIYCEDCISTWLDKERTCPICRTQIGSEDRTWRDGSTSLAIQIC